MEDDDAMDMLEGFDEGDEQKQHDDIDEKNNGEEKKQI